MALLALIADLYGQAEAAERQLQVAQRRIAELEQLATRPGEEGPPA